MPKKEITIEAAKKIVIDLKYLLPEFAIDVNHYYTNDIDNFNVACSAYIKAARYNIPLEEFYDYTQINRGYEVARDTISIIASVDPDYNGRSFYGAFCGSYPNRYDNTSFVLKKEISTETAKKITADLKSALPEFAKNVNDNSIKGIDDFRQKCSVYIKVVGNHIPLIKFYSEEQINRGYEVARDTISIIASVDPDYNGRSFYGAFCDAYSMYKRGSEFKLYTEDDIVYSSINDL